MPTTPRQLHLNAFPLVRGAASDDARTEDGTRTDHDARTEDGTRTDHDARTEDPS